MRRVNAEQPTSTSQSNSGFERIRDFVDPPLTSRYVQSQPQLRHRILGIDPGSRTTGFGVIDTDGSRSVASPAAVSASAATLA